MSFPVVKGLHLDGGDNLFPPGLGPGENHHLVHQLDIQARFPLPEGEVQPPAELDLLLHEGDLQERPLFFRHSGGNSPSVPEAEVHRRSKGYNADSDDQIYKEPFFHAFALQGFIFLYT